MVLEDVKLPTVSRLPEACLYFIPRPVQDFNTDLQAARLPNNKQDSIIIIIEKAHCGSSVSNAGSKNINLCKNPFLHLGVLCAYKNIEISTNSKTLILKYETVEKVFIDQIVHSPCTLNVENSEIPEVMELNTQVPIKGRRHRE